MGAYCYCEYYDFNDARFFTMILKPARRGRFPVVVTRSPYVSDSVDQDEETLMDNFKKANIRWAESNYVIVFQHCRGQGKSTGDFVPYVHEREDGMALTEWIRNQDFYDGRLFLLGGSYTASLHYCISPFEADIKGAVFNVQDSERYRLWYRNGCMRRGHANWHFNLYKAKSGLNKVHTLDSFSRLPLQDLSQNVLGDRAEDFEQMLLAPNFEHPFWQTRFGGADARDALCGADIPVLLTTGYNDFYVGGMFKMWNELDEHTRCKSAMIVSPYDHGDSYDAEHGICFPGGSVSERFGEDYAVKWFDSIVKNEKTFVNPGKIGYYRAFENKWDTDFYRGQTEEIILPIGDGIHTLTYSPDDPPSFPPEGFMMDVPGTRSDVITIYGDFAESDMFIKGKIRMKLVVSSDCEDTSFYVMLGIHTENGDYALRHDISSVLYQFGRYTPNEKIVMDFEFDEYAFALKKGQLLRVDIAPTDKNTYVCHTNIPGEYSSINCFRTAVNKVFADESFLILPIEK